MKKKIYPIMPPLEKSNYSEERRSDMEGLPAWAEDEMEKVARKENCDIRELEVERKLYYDNRESRWVESVEIIKEK